MKPLRLALLLLLPLLALSGCTIYDEDADLRLSWVFRGDLGCAEAGVVAVEVRILNLDTGQEGFAPVDCRAGSVEFHDVDKGFYFVQALAFGPGDPQPRWIAEGDLPSKVFGGFNEFTLILERF